MIAVARFLLRNKALHAKSIRTVRIQQLRNPRAAFSHHAVDAGERDLQLFGLGSDGQKQAALRRTRTRRFGCDPQFADGRSRRMRRQVQLQQLQKHLGIAHGHRQTQSVRI